MDTQALADRFWNGSIPAAALPIPKEQVADEHRGAWDMGLKNRGSANGAGHKGGNGALAGHLASLSSDGYRVIHSVALRRTSIDCVVIGPTGVFALQANTNPGRYRMDRAGWLTYKRRKEGHLVGSALFDATALRKALRQAGVDAPVETLVALTASRLPDGPIDMGEVRIFEASDVAGYISRRPHRMSAEEVMRAALGLQPTPSSAPEAFPARSPEHVR